MNIIGLKNRATRGNEPVVTVDGVMSGNREYNIRNGFTIPFTFSTRNVIDMMRHPRWLFGVMGRYLLTTGMPMYQNYPAEARAKLTAGPMGRSTVCGRMPGPANKSKRSRDSKKRLPESGLSEWKVVCLPEAVTDQFVSMML